ncbi:MAG: DUF1801 domain-containing protein [Ferruginibacter sp.]
MAKAKTNQTVETKASVADFVKTIKEEKKRQDFLTFIDLISKQTKFPPKMWGPAIVGFGSYHYKYDSGREGDSPLVGLASRAAGITFYLTNAREKTELLKKLGKHKMSGGCIHVQKMEDIDTAVLAKLIDNTIKYLKAKYPGK